MQEVLQKASQLVTLLENKLEATEVLNQQLSKKKSEQEEIDRKLKAAAANLSARERIVGKAEESVSARNEAKELYRKAAEKQALNNKRDSDLKAKEKELQEKTASLDQLKAVYKKKDEAIDALKIQLETERKLMKEKLLEELKGKL